jgi:endonuclease III
MNPAKRREIFLRLQAANPHPTTELEYKTSFELLVAVMLSAQISSRRTLFGVQFYLLPWRLI